MINSIELRNWKVHSNTKMSFAKGTNILVGMMGAGKSSILDSFSYALFGSFPALRDGRVSKSNIIANRPRQEQEAEVKLSFTADGDEYIVYRSIPLKGASKARLEKNGVVLQEQPERVTEEVERVLKVDYDLFTRAIYSEQNRLDYFLELRAGERKAEIDRLLGLDKFALASSNATSLIGKIKEDIKNQEKSVSAFDMKKMEEEAEKIRQDIDELRRSGAEIEKKVKLLREKIEEKGAALKGMKAKYNAKQELIKAKSDLESRRSVLEREAEKLPAAADEEEIRKEFEAKSKELEAAKKRAKEAVEEERLAGDTYAKASAQAEQILKSVNEMLEIRKKIEGKDIKDIASKIKSESELLSREQEELASYRAEKNETERWASELEKHISKCPVCERELDESMRLRLLEGKRRILDKINYNIEEAGRNIEKRKNEIERLNSELNSLNIAIEKTRELESKNEELSKLRAEIERLKKRHDDAKALREALEDTVSRIAEEVNSKKNAINEMDKGKRYRAEILEINRKIDYVAKEIEKITVSESEIEKMQSEFTKLNAEESRAAADLNANAGYIREKQRQLEEKERDISSLKKVYDEISKEKRVIEELTKFQLALEETALVLRTKLVDSINNVMQEIWPELYPYGDYTSIMLNATNDDYMLMLRVNRENEQVWEEVERIASGGERSIACLAMRVAFALVLVPNLKWLILDEPTHNIDRQGIEKFIRVFNETLPKIIDQIFIITHDEALKQVSNAKIYSLTRDKDANGAAVIQEL